MPLKAKRKTLPPKEEASKVKRSMFFDVNLFFFVLLIIVLFFWLRMRKFGAFTTPVSWHGIGRKDLRRMANMKFVSTTGSPKTGKLSPWTIEFHATDARNCKWNRPRVLRSWQARWWLQIDVYMNFHWWEFTYTATFKKGVSCSHLLNPSCYLSTFLCNDRWQWHLILTMFFKCINVTAHLPPGGGIYIPLLEKAFAKVSRWWFQIFLNFHPEPWGNGIQFDLRIFFRWVVSSTTN